MISFSRTFIILCILPCFPLTTDAAKRKFDCIDSTSDSPQASKKKQKKNPKPLAIKKFIIAFSQLSLNDQETESDLEDDKNNQSKRLIQKDSLSPINEKQLRRSTPVNAQALTHKLEQLKTQNDPAPQIPKEKAEEKPQNLITISFHDQEDTLIINRSLLAHSITMTNYLEDFPESTDLLLLYNVSPTTFAKILPCLQIIHRHFKTPETISIPENTNSDEQSKLLNAMEKDLHNYVAKFFQTPKTLIQIMNAAYYLDIKPLINACLKTFTDALTDNFDHALKAETDTSENSLFNMLNEIYHEAQKDLAKTLPENILELLPLSIKKLISKAN
jgi:hypothetical protein